jgi:hypothetical protein
VQLADIHMMYTERDFPSSHGVWHQMVTRGWNFFVLKKGKLARENLWACG